MRRAKVSRISEKARILAYLSAERQRAHTPVKEKPPEMFGQFPFGGGNEIRTRGLRVANAALYQLSHTPAKFTTVFPFSTSRSKTSVIY